MCDQGDHIRELVPVEYERLQGFGDHWTRVGIIDGETIEVSDTERTRCLGNAVSVPVVRAVAARMFLNQGEEASLFSMFAGIGGFEEGIRQALGDNAEFVGCAEIDKVASAIFRYHFPDVKNYGDVTKINTAELPDFNFLVGGFPCQAFSLAGKRLGFEDQRGRLFFEVVRIIKAKKPKFILLENVSGILSSAGGANFQIILKALSDAGYCCEWQILNSKNHGLAQHRERLFIVGTLGDEPTRDVFPIERVQGIDF